MKWKSDSQQWEVSYVRITHHPSSSSSLPNKTHPISSSQSPKQNPPCSLIATSSHFSYLCPNSSSQSPNPAPSNPSSPAPPPADPCENYLPITGPATRLKPSSKSLLTRCPKIPGTRSWAMVVYRRRSWSWRWWYWLL